MVIKTAVTHIMNPGERNWTLLIRFECISSSATVKKKVKKKVYMRQNCRYTLLIYVLSNCILFQNHKTKTSY